MTENYEVRKMKLDDLSMEPKWFQTNGDEPDIILRHLNWMMFYVEGESIPYYYMRNSEADKYRWGGVVKLGDGPLAPQTGGHYLDLAQKDAEVDAYKKVSDDPVTYSTGTKEPFSEQTFAEEYAILKEGDFLDFKCEYWPVGLFAHTESAWNGEYLYYPFTVTGTYEGKPVKGLGQIDRAYGQLHKAQERIGAAVGYVLDGAYSGIRKDGRREVFYGYIQGKNGHGVAYYWLEGEEPIITEEIYLETEFYHLPYLPAEDPTCACKDAVWRFADKEIHFTGRWGSRRFTSDPLDVKVGYSNSYGTWYEGKTPYEFELSHTFNESTTATIENLRKHGYKVFE